MLTSVSERWLVVETLFALKRAAGNRSILAKARSIIDKMPGAPGVRSLLGVGIVLEQRTYEQARTLQDLTQAYSGDPSANDDRKPKVPMSEAFRTDVRARNLRLWLKVMHNIPASPRSLPELQAALDQGDQVIVEDQKSKDIAELAATIFTPTLRNIGGTVGQIEAFRRLAGTSVRLLQSRLDGHPFPARLPSFGKLSVDPFDDAPLRYKRSGNGFVLYSIGVDQTDNGGVDGNMMSRAGYDIVWDFSGK